MPEARRIIETTVSRRNKQCGLRLAWYNKQPVVENRRVADWPRSAHGFQASVPTMRPLIAGNWKLQKTIPEAAELAGENCETRPGRYVDTRGSSGWNMEYVELGILALENTGAEAPDAGPEYIRKSDAELNRASNNG